LTSISRACGGSMACMIVARGTLTATRLVPRHVARKITPKEPKSGTKDRSGDRSAQGMMTVSTGAAAAAERLREELCVE
jgi:hypothetical protein